MGKLLKLDRARRPVRARATAGDDGKVLIFTGVRYERTGASPGEAGTGSPAASATTRKAGAAPVPAGKPRRRRG